jgi:tyrosinase
MWQVVHPDLWMVPESIGLTGNFVLEDNQVVDGNTPLSPFWKSSDSFWTSNDVRDTTILGYAYPETQSWIYASNAIYQRAVNTTISQSYSASARAMLTADGSGVTGNAQHINIDNSFTDWTINLEAVSSTIPSSFLVHFSFVGDFSSDSVKDVGMWTVLMVNTTGNQPEAEKIKRTITPEKKLEGSVSLTANLLDYVAAGMLKSLEAQDVVPFLRDKLTWMVWVSSTLLPPYLVLLLSNRNRCGWVLMLTMCMIERWKNRFTKISPRSNC